MAGSVSEALPGFLPTSARLPAGSRAGAAGAVGRAIRRIIFYRDGFDALEQRICKTKGDKTHWRMVLEHPEIPLVNNPAELEARIRVRKRVVSYGRARSQGPSWGRDGEAA